ncbi:MAG TPA: formyltransferase family protein [Chitinophagaceae bacterium]|nr:formyltransferase family protein [Chitinophagaceae bacterium]
MTRSDKKIALFGCKQTTKFVAEFINNIIKLDYLITINPELASKNEVADYMDLTTFCDERDIQCYSAEAYNLKNEKDTSEISDLKIDVAFVIGWQRLIPEKILNSISIGIFGMHGSSMNLPLGRGRSPMNWSIIEGRKVFYTNLFKYDAGVDSGEVLDTFKFSINNRDTAETMHFKNMLAMQYLIKTNINSILNNHYTLSKQPDIKPTYYPKRTPEDGLIDWNDDISRIERFIRAVAPPFDGAFSFVGDERITIYDAQIFDIIDYGLDKEIPGKIVEVFTDRKFLIKGYGGLLLVNSYKSSYTPKKGDLLNNNKQKIKYFETNKYGNYDLETH